MTTPPLAKPITEQLIAAIGADDVEQLQALFSTHGLDINVRVLWDIEFPHQSEPPVAGLLHIALYTNSHKVMEWLTENGIDTKAKTNISQLGHISAKDLAYSSLLKNSTPAQINKSIDIIDKAEVTPQELLLKSVRGSNPEGVRRAIEAGANIHVDCNDDFKLSLLNYAVNHNDLATMNCLIANGADVNAYCPITPLEFATSAGHTDAMRLLLEHGADPGLCSAKGVSLIFRAARSRQNTYEILDILFSDRVKLDPGLLNQPAPADHASLNLYSCRHGLTPLAYAIKETGAIRNSKAIPALIHRGADWRQPDESGQSILHQLMSKATTKLLPLLTEIIKDTLAAGVDPFLKNKEGVTAYEAAERIPEIKEVFKYHCRSLHAKAQHFNPAIDALLDAQGKPTRLLQYACYENLLADILHPSNWTGQEKTLIVTKLAITKALPEHYATKYDALLDVTTLRRNMAPKSSSWLKRYADTPPETRARDE